MSRFSAHQAAWGSWDRMVIRMSQKGNEDSIPRPLVVRHRARRSRRFGLGALVALVAVAVGLVTAVPAQADIGGYSVTGTGGVGLKVRSDPYNSAASVIAILRDGTPFFAVCAVRGRDVYGNTVWHKISAPVQGWIADFYTTTPGFNQYIPGEPDCNSMYNRAAARDWAYAHYRDTERYPGNDCTWFVSQALWAGRLPRTATWTDYQPDAINADRFKNAVIRAGYATITEVTWSDNTAGNAQVGDVIAYDWNGAADGFIDHVAIVTKLDPYRGWAAWSHPGPRLAGWSGVLVRWLKPRADRFLCTYVYITECKRP